MTRRTTDPDRQHEIAWGIRVAKDPTDMTRDDIEDALYSVAEYASRVLLENRALMKIVRDVVNTGKKP